MELTIEVRNEFDSLPKKNKDFVIERMKDMVEKEVARRELCESLRNMEDQAPDMTEDEVNDLINEAKTWARNKYKD